MSCIFCKIVRDEVPADIKQRDENCIVIADRQPLAAKHLLVISTEHIDGLDVLRDGWGVVDNLAHIERVISTAALVGARNMPGGFRMVINTGIDAGQVVRHLHVHLIGGEKLPDLIATSTSAEPDGTTKGA